MRDRDDDDLLRLAAVGLLIFIIIVFCSCQTYDVAVSAPEEFWLTAEALVVAVLVDLWSVVEFLM